MYASSVCTRDAPSARDRISILDSMWSPLPMGGRTIHLSSPYPVLNSNLRNDLAESTFGNARALTTWR